MYHMIAISSENPEGEKFAEYLNSKGHTAFINSTWLTFVDGFTANYDENAQRIFNDLWSAYCAETSTANKTMN